MVPVAKMKRNGEGKLVNDWQRVIGVILLLLRKGIRCVSEQHLLLLRDVVVGPN